MSSTTKKRQSSTGLKDASKALDAGDFFQAEALADQALETARAALDFKSMSDILPILRDARSLRFQEALAVSDEIRHMEAPFEEGDSVEPGCILVQPPFVGADARAMNIAALEQRVPVAIVCREPLTEMKLRPIVAIGRITVRTKVLRAADDANPDMDWFVSALYELGETAIESLDTGAEITRQIDGLMDRLATLPTHARLHDALAETCIIAAEASDT